MKKSSLNFGVKLAIFGIFSFATLAVFISLAITAKTASYTEEIAQDYRESCNRLAQDHSEAAFDSLASHDYEYAYDAFVLGCNIRGSGEMVKLENQDEAFDEAYFDEVIRKMAQEYCKNYEEAEAYLAYHEPKLFLKEYEKRFAPGRPAEAVAARSILVKIWEANYAN